MTLRRKFDVALLAACLAVLGWLVVSPMRPRPAKPFRPTFIAHRGYSDRFPENTIPSILEAARHGAAWIEVDVRKTADGQLVLHHDPTTLDVGLSGTVAQHTLAELQARPIAGSSERIPTLDQVLAAMSGVDAKLYLHLKDSPLSQSEAAQTVAACQVRDFLGRVRFNSGSLETLAMLRALAPQAWLEYDLYDAQGGFWPHHIDGRDLAALHALAVRSVGTFGYKVDESLVRQAHSNGLIIDALITAGGEPFLSEGATYRDMLSLGVDEIMTDHIARYVLK